MLSCKLRPIFEIAVLIAILLLAFLLRFNGLDWGLPYFYSSDEHYAQDALRMLETGDFNPHWFGHPGSFLMYSLALLFASIAVIYYIYLFLLGKVNSFEGFLQLIKHNPHFYFGDNAVLFHYSGRLLQVLFAIATVYLVYLTARKMFNKRVALLASFCLAISPLHIDFSRYIRTDISATTLVLFSIYFLINAIEQQRSAKFLILSSLFAGFAMASRYVVGVVIFPILTHGLVLDYKKIKFSMSQYFFDTIKINTNVARILLFVLVGFLIFAPFAVLNFEKAMNNIKHELRDSHLGAERLPGIYNYLWYLSRPLRGGVGGLFFEIFAAIGLYLVILEKSYKKYLFLFFPVLFFFVIASGNLKWERWAIPILPFEAILFGTGLYETYAYCVNKKIPQFLKNVIFAVLALILICYSVSPIRGEFKKGIILRGPDTRTIAKDWIETNLPQESKIAYEFYAPNLHVNPKRNFILMNMGSSKIVSKPISYYDSLSVGYIIITSNYKDRFYSEPEKYADKISRYEELKEKATLIKVFSNRDMAGPTVEIYKLEQK